MPGKVSPFFFAVGVAMVGSPGWGSGSGRRGRGVGGRGGVHQSRAGGGGNWPRGRGEVTSLGGSPRWLRSFGRALQVEPVLAVADP